MELKRLSGGSAGNIMNNKLKRVLDIIRKTGDKIIIFDDISSPDSAYMVMNIEDYEKIAINSRGLADLTEEELIDKINRDIAIWKSQQDFEENSGKLQQKSLSKEKMHTDIQFFEAEKNIDEESPEKFAKKWAIPRERKQAAEEVIEEDRQYFEEITF